MSKQMAELAPDFVTFFVDEYDGMTNVERLKRLKAFKLHERPDQVPAVLSDPRSRTRFHNAMVVLSDAMTVTADKRTEEQQEIFDMVKAANGSTK